MYVCAWQHMSISPKTNIGGTKYRPLLFHKMWSHMGVLYFYVCNCKFFKLHSVSWSSNFMNIHWLHVFSFPTCYKKCEPESHYCGNQYCLNITSLLVSSRIRTNAFSKEFKGFWGKKSSHLCLWWLLGFTSRKGMHSNNFTK